MLGFYGQLHVINEAIRDEIFLENSEETASCDVYVRCFADVEKIGVKKSLN